MHLSGNLQQMQWTSNFKQQFLIKCEILDTMVKYVLISLEIPLRRLESLSTFSKWEGGHCYKKILDRKNYSMTQLVSLGYDIFLKNM